MKIRTASVSRFVVPDQIPERTTWRYQCVLKDDLGAVIQLFQLTFLTLTIYQNDRAQTIVNSVNGIDILNTDRGTLGANNGVFSIKFRPDDTVILNQNNRTENRIALVRGVYNGTDDEFNHEIEFTVRNLSKIS